MPQNIDSQKIKLELEKLKREHAKFEAKINHLKQEQAKIIKQILAKSEEAEINKIKQSLK